ncbi:MAG: peptide chain release factor-like protein [Planctomycetaceae bacterium]|nr:peptide chain release factor-like protein [Planctomycetaceae bacterium]
MFDNRRALPRKLQLRCAHASAPAGGGDQSEHSVGNLVHLAIRWANRNHPGRLCLLEPKLAMPNINANVCHPSALEPESLLRDCSERRTRRSGPGGQHRNKVETAVVLRHEPTGIEAEGNERRSQAENRQVALFRLRVRLAVEVRTVRAPDQVPSELWRSRCPAGRISVNPTHGDFPALLAEALDVLAVCDFDIPAAAESLTCTGSQLVKLLKDERSAFERLTRERTARGLPRLR